MSEGMQSSVRNTFRTMERFFHPTLSLETDHAKRRALVADIGTFLAQWLTIQHGCRIETHTHRNGLRRVKQLKNGAQLIELIVEDGGSTFEQIYCKDKHGSLSLDQRIKLEKDRVKNGEWMTKILNYCEDYRELLDVLDRECSKQVFVDLAYAVAAGVVCERGGDEPVTESPEPGYFLAEEIDERVSVGGFAKKLANAIQEKVHCWLSECERAISERYFEDSYHCEESSEDKRRAKRVRCVLAEMISTHVAMEGFFCEDMCKYQGTTLNPHAFETLFSWAFDSHVREKCEVMRAVQIQELISLRAVCSTTNFETSARCICENQTSMLKMLRNIPRVLKERPGFKNSSLYLEMLIGIVRDATWHNLLLVAAQVAEWVHKVGRSQNLALSHWILESIDILEKQTLPNTNVLPTLGKVFPPMPTWTDPARASQSYVNLKACTSCSGNSSSLPKACKTVDRAYLPIPQSVELSLRLVSLVWELAGHRETYSGFFAPGHVMCSLVRQIVPLERVNTYYVKETVKSWMQAYALGQNYRNAVTEIQCFRGSILESDLRSATRQLSRWSLDDILTLSFEKSPLFLSNEWSVLDATLFSMVQTNRQNTRSTQRVMGGDNASVSLTNSAIRKALENACPVLFQIRNEARVSPSVASNEVVEFLYSIPAIRTWNRTGQELILTHEDVTAAGVDVTERLRQMSARKSLVHYGKRPSKERNVWKAMRVYTFNGYDLRTLLVPRT